MIDGLIRFAISQRLVVVLMVALLIGSRLVQFADPAD